MKQIARYFTKKARGLQPSLSVLFQFFQNLEDCIGPIGAIASLSGYFLQNTGTHQPVNITLVKYS